MWLGTKPQISYLIIKNFIISVNKNSQQIIVKLEIFQQIWPTYLYNATLMLLPVVIWRTHQDVANNIFQFGGTEPPNYKKL